MVESNFLSKTFVHFKILRIKKMKSVKNSRTFLKFEK